MAAVLHFTAGLVHHSDRRYLFVPLTYATLALLAHSLKRPRTGPAIAAGAVAGLAVTVRYAGLFLVAYLLSATAYFAWRMRWTIGRSARQIASLALGPLLAVAVAVSQNYATYGRLLGLARVPVPDALRGALNRGHELLGVLDQLIGGIGTWILLGAILFMSPGAEDRSPGHDTRESGTDVALAVLGGWIPFYLVMLLISVYPIVTDVLDDRLLSPVAPALVVTAVGVAIRNARQFRRAWLLAVVSLLGAMVYYFDAAFLRIRHPPETCPPSASFAWARARAQPTTVFVMSHGWSLRIRCFIDRNSRATARNSRYGHGRPLTAPAACHDPRSLICSPAEAAPRRHRRARQRRRAQAGERSTAHRVGRGEAAVPAAVLAGPEPDRAVLEQAKAALKDLGARTRAALDHAIKRAMDLIGADDAAAWFTHCGYEARAK